MKVVQLKTYQVLKERQQQAMTYRHRLTQMSKPELLQELLNYHESYMRDPNDVNATLRGQHLMDVLEGRAHLGELQELAREFQGKLKTRLYQQMQNLK